MVIFLSLIQVVCMIATSVILTEIMLFGYASDESKRAYEVVYNATDAGFEACKVGNTTTDIFKAMNTVMQRRWSFRK